MAPADSTILIVDDNAPFRHLIAAFLKKADYNTIEATNGLEALLLLKTEKIDAVLLDLQMLPVGGFAFMEEYNELGYTQPVIMITGDQSTDILARTSKMGIAGVLKKPVTEGRILQIVERILS